MNPPRKRILVIKLSSLGDIFHAIPAVNNLRVVLNAEVDWVTQPEYVELVKCFPMVSKVIPFPRRQFWCHFWKLVNAVREQQYDYVVDFQGLLKSALVTRLARGVEKIGPSFQREGAWLFYDVVAGKRDKNRHAVEENLDVVRHLGLPEMPVSFPVTFPCLEVESPGPRVALVPFSRRHNKNWPVGNYVELASHLQKEFWGTLYLFGSAADQAGCESIRAQLSATTGARPVINLAGRTSLVEMGGWFARMNLVVVNDSGPLHMAVAVGVPVVTFFGPTDPKRTGPYGARHHVIRSGVDCSPCFSKNCRLTRVECMERITPAQVMHLIREILGTTKADHKS